MRSTQLVVMAVAVIGFVFIIACTLTPPSSTVVVEARRPSFPTSQRAFQQQQKTREARMAAAKDKNVKKREHVPERKPREYVNKLYDLIPGRYPLARNFPDLLSSMDKTAEGRLAIMTFISFLNQTLKINIPEFAVDYILDHAETLCDYLALTPLEMHDLAVAASMVEGRGNNTPPITVVSPFNYPADINTTTVDFSLWVPTISEIAPGIWWGFFFPNETSMQQARNNIVMSLVFNELSANSHITNPAERFVVVYEGEQYTDVRAFLLGLLAKEPGVATVDLFLSKRIAAFFGIYTKENGTFYEIADPMFVESGITSSKYGSEDAILPAIHSEYVLDVRAGGVYWDIVWYEGDNGIGFFPGQMYVIESWVGDGVSSQMNGTEAIEAITYMSLFGDILLNIAYEDRMFDWGYAISGVCDDSCGVIEVITLGESTEYPNLMTKALVVPEVLARIKLQDSFSHYYYKLLSTVSAFPMDWRLDAPDPTIVDRALGTIVWPVGREPFQSVVDARNILTNQPESPHLGNK